MKISVTIITFNEEKNIERAIRSVQFADEVIVVDSQSTDKTIEIVEKLGAKLYQWPFEGFGQQKNYAASLCQGEWILNIDADEEVSESLRKSIQQLIQGKQDFHTVYQMKRLNFFCGKPIYHGGWYPDLKKRLCLRDKASWSEPFVHEDLRPIEDKPIGILEGELLHYSFPTVKSQIQTNFKYASLGSFELKKKLKGRPSLTSILIRPFLKFIECYLLKLGFMDGLNGFIIAINAAHSMFMKYTFAYLDENND